MQKYYFSSLGVSGILQGMILAKMDNIYLKMFQNLSHKNFFWCPQDPKSGLCKAFLERKDILGKAPARFSSISTCCFTEEGEFAKLHLEKCDDRKVQSLIYIFPFLASKSSYNDSLISSRQRKHILPS